MFLSLLLLAAAAPDARPVSTDWRRVATAADRVRLRGWRETWLAAMAEARAGGGAAAIAAEGELFDPDRAVAGGPPPAGDYRCRVFKLGTAAGGTRAWIARAAFTCRIDEEGAQRSFYKLDGAQRPVGLIFTQGPRAVFLGTMMLGDEQRALDYGRDAKRDLAGWIDRIGPKRWRIMLPAPAFESKLDVVELVPIS